MPNHQNFYHLKNIAVASDFLPYATQALKIARKLSDYTHANVTLIHLLQKFSDTLKNALFPYAAMGSDENAILAEIREMAVEQGKKYLEDLRITEQCRLVVNFARDSLAKSILFTGNEVDTELMFIGSYGTKPHTTGMIGSLAGSLIAHARFPVYLVRDPFGVVEHKKILVVLIQPQFAESLLEWAVSFAVLYPDCDVEIITPIPNLTDCDISGDFERFKIPAVATQTAVSNATRRAKNAMHALTLPFTFEKKAEKMSFKHHLPKGSPVTSVLKVAEDSRADLIVIPVSQPNLEAINSTRDIARTISEYASPNILFIPEVSMRNKIQFET